MVMVVINVQLYTARIIETNPAILKQIHLTQGYKFVRDSVKTSKPESKEGLLKPTF